MPQVLNDEKVSQHLGMVQKRRSQVQGAFSTSTMMLCGCTTFSRSSKFVHSGYLVKYLSSMTYDSLQGPKSFKSKDSSSLKQEEINFLISRLFCSNHSDFKSVPHASEAAHRF